jgi:hypothetical protein
MLTASFQTYTGPGRISIARYAPRRTPAGFRIFSALAPGSWFNSVSREEYERLYKAEMLDRLDPLRTWNTLHEMAGRGNEPILLCWEKPPFSEKNWCHRQIVARWFKEQLGYDVDELPRAFKPLPQLISPSAPRTAGR